MAGSFSLRWEPTGIPLRLRTYLHAVLQTHDGRTVVGGTSSSWLIYRRRLNHMLTVELRGGFRTAVLPLLGDKSWQVRSAAIARPAAITLRPPVLPLILIRGFNKNRVSDFNGKFSA